MQPEKYREHGCKLTNVVLLGVKKEIASIEDLEATAINSHIQS